MKKLPVLSLAVAALLALISASAHAAIQASYYVDPVSGNDGNSGTSPTSAFLTLTRAQTAVEAIDNSMTGDIVVNLMPGDHIVTSPVNLTQADAGTNGFNIIWTAYGPKGSARLIGGTKVTGWSLYSGNIYQASVGPGLQRFEAIFENGVRGHLARYPNTGYLDIGADDTTYPAKKFQWKSTDTIPAVANPTDLQVLVWPGNHDWSTEIHNVATVDRSGRWITLTENISEPYLGNLTAGSRYYLQGAIELLDTPGEFYYDSSAGVLYYYPYNSPISSQEIIIPTTTTIFNVGATGSHNLEGLWQFEENTDDSSPAQNDGTAINSPTYITSMAGLGEAISLDGSTQYVTIPDDPSLEFGPSSTPFTIAAWINTSDTGIQPIVVKARPDPGALNMDYKFWLNATGHLELQRWNKANSATSVVTDSTGPALNDGTWHHVAFVNEGDTSHKLYVDGNLETTSTTAWTYGDNNSEAVEIGRFADNNNNIYYYFDGAIDDARIYQSALSATDVAGLYALQNIDPVLQNMTFMNLKFFGSNLDYTNPGGGNQAMLNAVNCSDLLIENNEFDCVGGNAINVGGGGTAVTVTGNFINGAGIGGVSLGAFTYSLVSNNRINNTGLIFPNAGSSITFGSTTYSTVSYNTLSVCKRQGISLRNALNNTVEFNEVWGMDTDSQDTAAIKWGDSNNNQILNNRAHDSGQSFGAQYGLYIEDGSNDNTVKYNIVYGIGPSGDSNTAAINVKGIGNVIQNDVFDFTQSNEALNTYEVTANGVSKNETIQYNIMYSTGSAVTLYNFQSFASTRIKVSDHNDFYKTSAGSYVMYNIPGADTLGNWKTIQSNQYDQHSVTTNPGFVNAAAHDYDFVSAPPSGFTTIPTATIGLQPNFIYPSTDGQWIFSGDETDITLNGNDGTLVSGTLVADRYGTASSALSLNGSTDYVTMADSPTLQFGDPANPFAIVAWVKTTSASAAGLVAKARETNTPNMDYRFQMLSTGAIQFSRWNQSAGVTDSVATTAIVNDGSWHQVAFVNESASSHKLYIDGVLSATSTTTWTYNDSNSEPVRIGRDHNGTTSDQYFNGTIDDVAILSNALQATDLEDLDHIPHS